MNPERHVNGLTKAEHERLAFTFEELAEAIQIVGKIMRHGYDSRNPDAEPGTLYAGTNRELLEIELGDVEHAIYLLCSNGDVRTQNIENAQRRKEITAPQWFHYQ